MRHLPVVVPAVAAISIFGPLAGPRASPATAAPTSVAAFDNTAGPIVAITHDPVSSHLIAIRWDQNPIRIIPPAPACPADLNGDGTTNGADLGLMLAAWGVCAP